MFRLTEDSTGGMLLLMLFAYSVFIMGAAIWVETKQFPINGEGEKACCNLGTCMFTMFRLSFFDGEGKDRRLFVESTIGLPRLSCSMAIAFYDRYFSSLYRSIVYRSTL